MLSLFLGKYVAFCDFDFWTYRIKYSEYRNLKIKGLFIFKKIVKNIVLEFYLEVFFLLLFIWE